MTPIIAGVSVWLVYEIAVGVQVVKNQVFKEGKKWGYVPWSVMFADDHKKYLDWREWKGDRF